MLEDNKLDAKLIKEELMEKKFDFIFELVETEKDFISAIPDFKPDIILSDYTLPHFTDLEGNITAWNAGATKTYGYSEQEAFKMNVSDLVHEEYKAEALNFIIQLKKGELRITGNKTRSK